MTAKVHTVFITGESPLVGEYARLCIAHGFSVNAHPNDARTPLPKGVRKAPSPPRSTSIALELTNIDIGRKQRNMHNLDKALRTDATIIASSTTISVAEQASWVSHPRRLVGLGALPTLISGPLVELAPGEITDERSLDAAKDFFTAVDKDTAIVRDSVGLVMPRILCMLANEACFAMMDGVADAGAIDTAMKLGTHYPSGPVEWAERIGLAHVQAVVRALHGAFGEERYRVAPLLRREAIGSSFPER